MQLIIIKDSLGRTYTVEPVKYLLILPGSRMVIEGLDPVTGDVHTGTEVPYAHAV